MQSRRMKIKDICRTITDGSHNPPQGVGKSEYMMLSSKNIFDDEITFNEPRYLSQEEFFRENKRTMISEGDVLLTIVGTVGRSAVVNKNMSPFTLQRSVAVLHPKNDICDSRFLMYALRGKRSYIENRAKGVAQKGIYLGEVSEIDINVPDIIEQQVIVEKLDKVFNIIKLRKKELEQFENLMKGRFVEMFGDQSTNPRGWNETTIGDECFYIKDGPHKSLTDIGKKNGGYPFISVRNIVNGHIDFSTAKYISNEDYADAIKKCHPEKGDMLYSKGGTTGIAKLIDIDEEFANWVHVAVLKFDKSRLNGVFFENMLNGTYCYEQSQRLTKGIANRDLVLSAMAQIKIYCPPMELQNQFADFVKQVNKSRVVLQFTQKMANLLSKYR